MQPNVRNAHPIAPQLGFNFAPPPYLEYLYPPPSEAILANIRNALISVPRFYTQVLHLMNKMNMPPPFGPETAKLGIEAYLKSRKRKKDDLLSSDESEMSESGDESDSQKKSNQKENTHKSKLPKSSTSLQVSQVKNSKSEQKQAKMVIRIGQSSLSKITQSTEDVKTEGVIAPDQHVNDVEITKEDSFNVGQDSGIHNEENHQSFGQSSSGNEFSDSFDTKVAHQVISNSLSNKEDPSKTRNVISATQLQQNRLSPQEMAQQAVFKKYSPGIPSNVLYIKNLNHKVVTEQDLLFILGRYFDSDEDAKEKAQIKLMVEGKLKGQAFITLPSAHLATQILQEVHGYVLHEKPMIIAFSRRPADSKDEQ